MDYILAENCKDTVNICSSVGSDTAGDALSSYDHMMSGDKLKQPTHSVTLTNCS